VQRQGRAIALASALCAAALGLAWVVTEAERNKLADQRHHDAVVVHERVVQELVAAKWAIEAGHPERGLEIVTNALTEAQDAVSQLRRDEQTGPDGWPGRRH
jgi:UDP-N-acetylmuramyl tripeptide synthase